MLFLINNPVLFIGLLLMLTLMGLLGRQMFKEIQYNRLLENKKRALRYYEGDTRSNKRLYMIGSLVLAPILVIGLFLGLRFGQDDDFVDDRFLEISSGEQIFLLQKEFRDKYLTNYRNYMFGMDAMAEADSPQDAGGEGSDDYSETNNQVEGVDEMDNVVTDGKFIYSIRQNTVEITLAYTMEEEYDVLSHYKTISYDEYYYPTGLYIDDDYLVVIGYAYTPYEDQYDGEADVVEEDYRYYYQQNRVSVKVYNVQEDYQLEREYGFSGSMIGTRKLDDQLIIITSNYLPYTEEEIDTDAYLPTYSIDDQEYESNYEDIRYIEGSNPNVFLTFYSVQLGTENVDQNILLGDSAYNLYVSNSNIYLVGSVYMFSPLAEYVNLEEPVTETKTAIIKLSIDEYALSFRNLAHINGFPLNQFSMDEYQGYLRITTTTSRWRFDGDNEINNRLYILDENLEVVSLLENLGKPGETIQSTRFVGEYAYLVTFEQTDPFYVIDVSNPEDPFVEGELEIPGFSTYLQPFGEDFMLGIGFGDTKGGTRGIKISLYDIRDKTNPIVHDEIIYDYSQFGFASTSVTYNHKDLLLSYAKGLIALPFTTYNYNESDGNYYNSGIMVFHIDEDNYFQVGGYVQHEVNSRENVYVYKSKFIDQYLYTVSNQYIKVSTIDDPLTILKSTTFE